MAADEPPYLTVGTDVSAKYKGAFCEAKIKKVNRVVKCKVTFKNNNGSCMVPDDQIRGSLRIGALVEARHPEKNQFLEAIINKMQDYSQYTVVFDDGDETTLRRTSLCLKSGRHFAESPTLDQFPLTNPEHFGTPVIGAVKSKRKRRSTYNSSTVDFSSSDEELIVKKTKAPRRREKEPDIGKVVCIDYGDRRKKDSWYPGLVVSPTSSQDSVKINIKEEYLIRSFKDGKYYQVPKKDTREFGRDVYRKVESNTLRTAVDKALLYCEKGELPAHWDKAMEVVTSGNDDSHDTDTDSSDDEPSEEKDRFVAQLYKFMDERGTPINKAPTVANRDVNLYKLFKVVHKMGGYNRVTNQNRWKIVYTKMGLLSSNPTGSNQLKLAYKRFLHSFEDFYRKLGCTMVSNSRSTRGRHRSDRNFIITRNAVSAKARNRVKDKSAEKKPEEKLSGSERKEKSKSESPKSDGASRKRIDKGKVEEKEQKVKGKKEDEKPRLVRSQSLNKDKLDNTEEKKDTRTDRARAREESKREKTESPEKKKETRSSAKFDQEREKREKEAAEKKLSEAKEAKDRSPKEKKQEKPIKQTKIFEQKVESPPKEKKPPERRWLERTNKEDKMKPKIDEKRTEKETKDEDVKERKLSKVGVELMRTEVELFTKDKKETLSLDRNDVLQLRGMTDDKSWSSLKITTEDDDELLAKDKPPQRKLFAIDSEPSVILSEIKTEKDDGTDIESSPYRLKGASFHDDDDDDMTKEGMRKRRSGDELDDSKSFHDLTDSDDDDDGSGSEKSEKEGKEQRQVEVGDKVKVKYGRGRTRKVYEAKVLKIDVSTGEKRYFVHYTGWNVRYDEWVKRSFIVENMSERNKFSRLRRQDLYNKNPLTLVKKIDPSKPPGLSAAPKLTRKNSTSSTTSVSSSRTTRSDKNNSLHTSPYSKGLQPKRRMRRKSGLSVALTDTSQDSESDDNDLLYLYPDGELHDEEEGDGDAMKKGSELKREIDSDLEVEREPSEVFGRESDEKIEKPVLLPQEPKSDGAKRFFKAESPRSEPSTLLNECRSISLKDSGLKKFEYNFNEGRVPCIFAKKMSIVETNISKLMDKDARSSKFTDKESKPMKLVEKETSPKSPVKEAKFPKFGERDVKTSAQTEVPCGSSEQVEGGDETKNEPTAAKTATEKLMDKISGNELKIELIKEPVPLLTKLTEDKVARNDIKAETPMSVLTRQSVVNEPVLTRCSPPPPVEIKEVTALKEAKLIDEKMPPLMTYMGSSSDPKCSASKPMQAALEAKFSTLSPKILPATPTLRLRKEILIPSDGDNRVCLGGGDSQPESKPIDKVYNTSPSPKPKLLNVNVSSSVDSCLNKPSVSSQPYADLISCKECMEEKSLPGHGSGNSSVECSPKPHSDINVIEEAPESITNDEKTNIGQPTSKSVNVDELTEKEETLTGSSEPEPDVSSFSSQEMVEGGAGKEMFHEKDVDEKEEEVRGNVICPPKIPTLEIATSYSSFPLRQYFMDFGKPTASTEDAQISSKKEKEEPSEEHDVCCETDSKPVQEEVKERFSPKNEDNDDSKTMSVCELKDFGLQTSVITFARSSTNSSTCTSVTEPDDSLSQNAIKEPLLSPLSDCKKSESEPNESCNESGIVDEPKLSFSQTSPVKPEVVQQEDSVCTSATPPSEEKNESISSPVKTEVSLDDSIHESLTELSIDDESQDHSESDKADKSHSSPPNITNVFLNITSDKSEKDGKDLFFPKKVADDDPCSAPQCEEGSPREPNESVKQQTSLEKLSEDEKTVSSRDTEETTSPSSGPSSKKEGKKKKSKISKDKKVQSSDPSEKDETKVKEGKGKSKKKKTLDTDEFSKLKDPEQKTKTKKLKKNKNKKRFTKYEDPEPPDDSKEGSPEKIKRKEKRKRDDKKFAKFDLKSDSSSAFKGDASKKERKKGRKNKLGGDKKAELGDKKVKKKKKIHTDENIDTDSEKETVIRPTEKKKERRKKIKPKDTSSSDDGAEGKLLIDESNTFDESQEKNEDPDMSFLLCEEKVPASPVNALPEDTTTASSSIEDSNNVSPSSDEEQVQPVSLEMFPRAANLEMLNSVNKHNPEACAVLDNTPPTTPSSTGSISSSSPSRDREPFIHYTESTQSGRDSGDGESDSFQCESNRTEISESEEYRAAATLAFAVCKSVPEKPRDCRMPLKRQKSESDDFSPSKRRRKSKRSFGVADTPVKTGQARVKGLSRYSKGESCDAFDLSAASTVTVGSPPRGHSSTLFSSFAHSSMITSDSSSNAAGRSSKVNCYVPLHEFKDPEKRIAVLQDKMAELKKVYASLKQEVATIDRRRKKARKKMREAAGSTANNSSTHSEDAQNYS